MRKEQQKLQKGGVEHGPKEPAWRGRAATLSAIATSPNCLNEASVYFYNNISMLLLNTIQPIHPLHTFGEICLSTFDNGK